MIRSLSYLTGTLTGSSVKNNSQLWCENPTHTFFMINASHYLKKLSLLYQFKSKINIHVFRMVSGLPNDWYTNFSNFSPHTTLWKAFSQMWGRKWPLNMALSAFVLQCSRTVCMQRWGRLVVTETNSDKSSRECQGSPWGNCLRHRNLKTHNTLQHNGNVSWHVRVVRCLQSERWIYEIFHLASMNVTISNCGWFAPISNIPTL